MLIYCIKCGNIQIVIFYIISKNGGIRVKKVRTIIWDLDDTVWFYKEDEPKILCEKLNIGQEENFKEEYYGALGNLFAYFKDEIVTYDKVKKFIDERMPILRLSNVSVGDFLQMLCAEKKDVAVVNQEAIEMMGYFKERGLRNISITDWFAGQQEIALAQFDANTYIEKIYGCDNTYFKNSIGKLSQIIEELQLEKRREEVVMIGDSLSSDIFFANKLGIRSVWYNPKGKKNTTDNIPTLEVKSLLELKKVIF